MSSPRDRFAAFAAAADDRINTAEAALTIAQEEYPALNVRDYLARLDALAADARAEVAGCPEPRECIARLNRLLFVRHGFRGNDENYYDPRNSYLNDVLDRRTGIPITLSLVYAEVAQRAGLPVYGVSFPGHFLVKYAAERDILVDAFFGRVIDEDECTLRLRRIYGRDAQLEPRLLRPASARDILVRMLSNLKQIYVEGRDYLKALGCVERILLLTPDHPRELRDRGILYQRLECFGAALRDFERYLQLAPDDDAAQVIRATLPDLQRQAASVQ